MWQPALAALHSPIFSRPTSAPVRRPCGRRLLDCEAERGHHAGAAGPEADDALLPGCLWAGHWVLGIASRGGLQGGVPVGGTCAACFRTCRASRGCECTCAPACSPNSHPLHPRPAALSRSGPNYFEVDVDITSNTVANSVTRCRGRAGHAEHGCVGTSAPRQPAAPAGPPSRAAPCRLSPTPPPPCSLVVGAITSLVVDLAPLVEGQVRRRAGGCRTALALAPATATAAACSPARPQSPAPAPRSHAFPTGRRRAA